MAAGFIAKRTALYQIGAAGRMIDPFDLQRKTNDDPSACAQSHPAATASRRRPHRVTA
jgi:hypothetical protein